MRLAQSVYGIGADDRLYQGRDATTGFAVESMWLALAAGATLVPEPGGLHGQPLHRFLWERRVTGMYCSPALLAGIVAQVIAVEENADLVAAARTALAGETKVEVVQGALNAGHAAAAPYDVLVIDGAVEELPAALVEQVKIGGRIVTGLVENGVTRLASGRRTEGGHGVRAFADAECTILPGFARPRAFQF